MTTATNIDPCFHIFKSSVAEIPLPQNFTFPFYYEPHELTIIAAEELQKHLSSQNEWTHNFGLVQNADGLVIGKMFGVLVVQNQKGQLGYLSAFSGKLAGGNHHTGFVAPVFDILREDGFFRKGEIEINDLTLQIEALEKSIDYVEKRKQLLGLKEAAKEELSEMKIALNQSRSLRKQIRKAAISELNSDDFEQLMEQQRYESLKHQYEYKQRTLFWEDQISLLQKDYDVLENQILLLREERKNMSNSLQQKLFAEYYFLNKQLKKKSLGDIFSETTFEQPPAGAGECAAPKLLQHAFVHGYKPIALGEFWWGESPKSEIRKHKQFYPSCRGKCEPILRHMLDGIEMDQNPIEVKSAHNIQIETIFEDDDIVIINKPAEFLSVPGKMTEDSIYLRMKMKYPQATGPLIVHRLDMSTSGIMVIAKTKEANKELQSQFIKRHVKKRYVALLDGILENKSGSIDLPLRVDLDDRPRQLVCYSYGKSARTNFEVIEVKNGKTKIHFYPITGRTHQLRVHSAHPLGLNIPIVGDDLYGKKAQRLHLHAEWIQFTHPTTNEKMQITVAADF